MADSRRRFLRHLASAPFAAAANSAFRAFGFLTADDLAERLAADPLRPQFHLLPAKNWMNDPNGPILWKGMYHMFFQYNPGAAVWGDMHWAHAMSPDMIHWKHLPVALAPTPGWHDGDGCFTGSAVDDHGTATFIYTGVKAVAPELATLRDGHSNLREVQCLATSTDPQLLTWNKWQTPVLQPPRDPLLTGFRDPFLWCDGETWYLGLGSGVRKQGGRVLLYRSKDLRQWEYLHPLASGKWTEHENVNPVDSGEMWECPDFFRLCGRHVLLYSTSGQVAWESGELDPKELVFHSQRRGLLDHGAYYAQKTQLDGKGNRILWGWIPEKRSDDELRKAGWAGCMALPRVLSLNAQGDLEMRVAPEAQILRDKTLVNATQKQTSAQRTTALREVRIENICGELKWSSAAGPFSFTLADHAGPWWLLKAEGSSSMLRVQINEKVIEIAQAGDELRCHLFVDASVAEFFCNGRHVLTSRMYRQPDGPIHLEIANENLAALHSMEAWQLRPISKNRLTT
jgi:beta-fructofuranosidase